MVSRTFVAGSNSGLAYLRADQTTLDAKLHEGYDGATEHSEQGRLLSNLRYGEGGQDGLSILPEAGLESAITTVSPFIASAQAEGASAQLVFQPAPLLDDGMNTNFAPDNNIDDASGNAGNLSFGNKVDILPAGQILLSSNAVNIAPVFSTGPPSVPNGPAGTAATGTAAVSSGTPAVAPVIDNPVIVTPPVIITSPRHRFRKRSGADCDFYYAV